MKHFLEAEHRTLSTIFPELLDDYVDEKNPVRVIEAFVGEYDLRQLGFQGVDPHATGRPSSDIVLNVEDIKKIGSQLGRQTTLLQIDNAQHDIFLSPKKVRDEAFKQMFAWL